jgi:DNA-binding CsgD family transcriptional regulator
LLDRAGAVLPEVTRAAVLAVAAGNPLALAELPRFAGRIECGPAALALTDRLVAVFGGRAGQLDADARADLLRAALDGITAGTVASRSRFVIGDGESAVAAGLLVVDASGQYVFRHPLVRAAVVHQASPVQRRAAHRELAGLYPDVLVRRATHLAAAAVEPDQEVADLLEQAAQLSIRRGGLPVAVEWLRRAAELSTDSDRRTALLAEAVFVAARAGRPGEVTELVDSAETRGANSANAALFAAYRAFHADGEVISTHRRLIEVLAKSDTIDGKTVNRLANLLLSITNFAGDAEKRERTNVALAALGTRVAPTILMYRTGVDSIVNTTSGIRSLLATYAEFLPKLEPRMVMLLSFPAYCVDAMAQFRYPLEQAFTQLSEHGASIDAIEGGRVLLLDMMAGGHWDRAEKVGAQCLEMAGEVQGSELVRHQLLGDLGVFAAWRGDLETARRNAADVTAWAAPRGLHLLVGVAQRIAVRVALAEADYETAYQAAIGISAPGHFPRQNIQVGDDMLDLVEALINTGRVEEARAHVAEAVRLNLAEVSPRVAALTTAITAMTAPDSDAEGLYQSALGHPGIADFPFEHARIALAHGMWLRRQLRHTAARGALGLAAETFDRLGARPWADRAGAELRAAGASVSRSSGEPATLSTQERRIADLAADGKSNKEIAAALSLAPRTVESHLHRVFRKLGITRRSALNKALREHA